MKKKIAITLSALILLGLVGCKNAPPSKSGTKSPESLPQTVETTPPANPPKDGTYVLPEDFKYPITDGSTSTTNLDNAVKSAILGGEQVTSHTKTYTSFQNLLEGKCEVIFTTPLSKQQLDTMESRSFRHEAEPVAGEGFVFVVNKDNPVDTLTVEQLKGIYSGKITNWKELGGNDAPILAYQRNADSGSQNYMISFMGDIPLMTPITDETPASMSGILDVIAHYDNGIDAIGYSVYAYSDGMYEDVSKIKYIKVNGVEPSLETLADGTYPLLGYNYAVFSADLPEDSNVRHLVKWIQSDEGQQVVANAGYVPYRKVDGLTLPTETAKKLYTAVGTSGIVVPEVAADYYYEVDSLIGYSGELIEGVCLDESFMEKVAAFVEDAKRELNSVDKEKVNAHVKERQAYTTYGGEPQISKIRLMNGYLSVTVGIQYTLGFQDSPFYYYDARSAVFDIYTGEQLEFSDLFFEGHDFAEALNVCIAAEAAKPFSSMNEATHSMLRDYSGLYEGEFTFTADSVIFFPGNTFVDGAEISLDGISEYMVTSIPRDMKGFVVKDVPVYKRLNVYASQNIGYGEEVSNNVIRNMGIWYVDKDKVSFPEEACDKINAFVKSTYDEHYTVEKLTERLRNLGITADSMEVGLYPAFNLTVCGDRYIEFHGTNIITYKSGEKLGTIPVLEGHGDSNTFKYYFNPTTGERLRITELFTDGFEDAAKLYTIHADSPYTGEVDMNSCEILSIEDYAGARRDGTLSDLELPVIIVVRAENGDAVTVSVPREYIK